MSAEIIPLFASEPVLTPFDTWYAGYPRKRERRDAAKAYNAAVRKGYTHTQLLQARDRLVRENREQTFTPYPAGFLRRCLEDYLDSETHSAPRATSVFRVVDGHKERFLSGTGWIRDMT